jgi:hypothetical protein
MFLGSISVASFASAIICSSDRSVFTEVCSVSSSAGPAYQLRQQILLDDFVADSQNHLPLPLGAIEVGAGMARGATSAPVNRSWSQPASTCGIVTIIVVGRMRDRQSVPARNQPPIASPPSEGAEVDTHREPMGMPDSLARFRAPTPTAAG